MLITLVLEGEDETLEMMEPYDGRKIPAYKEDYWLLCVQENHFIVLSH